MASFADLLVKNLKGFIKGIGTSVSNAYSAPISLGGTILSNKKISDTDYKTQQLVENALKLREANRAGNKNVSSILAKQGREISNQSEKTKQSLINTDKFTSNLREKNSIGQSLYDKQRSGNYANTILQALKEGAKSSAYTYGLVKGNLGLKNPLNLSLIAGGTLLGDKSKNFGERFGESVGNTPYYAGFNKATNPYVEKLLSPLMKAIPATKQLTKYGIPERVSASVLNVAQGIGSDVVSGRKPDALSIGIDAGIGLVGGKQVFDESISMNARKKPVMDSAEADEIFNLKKQYDLASDNTDLTNPSRPKSDSWGNIPEKSMDEFGMLGNRVTSVFKHYFPEYKKVPTTEKQLELLTKMANENKFDIPRFGMGFADDKPRTPSKVEVDLNRYKSGEAGYQLKGVKVDQEYLDLLKKKGFDENQINYAIKITNEAGDVKNAKGFVFGVLRKMNPGVEKKIGYTPSLRTSVEDALKIDEAIARDQAKSITLDQSATIPTSPEVVKPTIDLIVPPIIPTPEKIEPSFSEKIVTTLSNLKKTLVEPKKISRLTDSERGTAIQAHVSAFNEMGQQIKSELASRGISEPDFALMVRGEKEIDPKAVDLVESWKNIFKHEDATFRANKEFGKQENYFPIEGEQAQIDRTLTEFLPDTFVSKINKMLGHYLPSTGKMAKEGGYNTDPAVILHNYGEQEAISRYDKKGLFQAEIEKVVKNIQNGTVNLYDKKGKTITDYLEMLNPSKDRIKNNTEIHSFIGEDWATNENRNFSKLGDDIYSAYIQVRDNKANTATLKDEFSQITESLQKIEWLMGKLNITDPKQQVSFRSKANWIMETMGDEKLFNSVASKLMYDQPIQNLLDTLTKYEFDGTTKKFLNEWIERQFAERFVTKSLSANIADGVNRIFRIAQLGMNFKTAALQPLEIFRSFAKYPKETFKNAFNIPELIKVKNKYKTSGSNPYFIDEDTIKIHDVSIPKKALSKVEQAGFFALQKMEDYKNAVFATVAEKEGLKLGLEGQKLTDYVRNYVYKYGLKMDQTTIPLMFAGKSDGASFRRLLFQYGQYAVSKLVHRVDAIKEKDWKYLARMIGGDLATFTVLSQLFGVKLENYLKGEGMISFGPIVGLGEDLFSAGKEYTTDLQSDNPEEANANLVEELKRIGMANFMPYGAQINKTKKMADILNKGYYESAGGRVGYVPPENPIKQGWGLVAGVQSTKEKQTYDKSGYKVLPQTTSDQIKEVMKTDKETGRQMYSQARAAEETKKEEKRLINKTMSEILKGKTDITPESKSVVENRQAIVTNLVKQGITNTNEIKATIDYQIRKSGLTTPSPTLSEIEVYKNLAKTSEPASLYDTVTQNKAEKDRQNELNRIMTSSDYGEITQDQRTQIASKLGFTDTDLKTWQVSQLTKMTTKETADYIVSNRENDFVSLYKADALTPSVAQELERRGYIEDADALMENLKLTDPYYQRKALRKAKLDFGKKKLKLQADTATKLNNENFKTMKQILAKKNTKSFKPKSIKFTSSRSTRPSLAKPTKYTIKKLTTAF